MRPRCAGICEITGVVAGGTFLLAALASYLLARHITEPIRSLQTICAPGGGRGAGGEGRDSEQRRNRRSRGVDQHDDQFAGAFAGAAAAIPRGTVDAARKGHSAAGNSPPREKQHADALEPDASAGAAGATAETQQILRESEARIRSMGLIHEKLYQSESISAIDMHGYLKTLTEEILRMGGGGPAAAKSDSMSTTSRLGLDTALPCGLIVTELVQNSLKYAFPDGHDGVILVRLHATGSRFSLVVWDNGVGFPEDAKPTRGNSLGMRLVRMLTDQLHGNVSMTGQQGTRIEITFKETQYRERL